MIFIPPPHPRCVSLVWYFIVTRFDYTNTVSKTFLLIFFPFIILFSESTADKRAWRLRHSQRRAGTALVFRIVVRRTLWHGRRDGQREYYCFMFLSLSVRVNVCVNVTCVGVLYNYHVNPKPFAEGVCVLVRAFVFFFLQSQAEKNHRELCEDFSIYSAWTRLTSSTIIIRKLSTKSVWRSPKSFGSGKRI